MTFSAAFSHRVYHHHLIVLFLFQLIQDVVLVKAFAHWFTAGFAVRPDITMTTPAILSIKSDPIRKMDELQ